MSNRIRQAAIMALLAALLIPTVQAEAKERRIAKPASIDVSAAQLEDNETLRRTLAPRTTARALPARQTARGR